MSASRLILAAAVLALVAACDNSPKPPAKPADVAEQPVAEAPVAAPAKAEVKTPVASQLRPASAEATAPLFGTWAVDLAECTKPGSTLAISVASFESAGQKCSISGLGDNGDGSYTATLACSGDKSERVAMTPLFAPTGEGIGIVWLDRGNEEETVLRCN